MVMLKRKRAMRVLVCALTASVLCSCGGDKKNTNTGSGTWSGSSRPAGAAGVQEQQTVSDKKVVIRDITAYAGEEIDYVGAIESAENLEINRSMIYVDSSAVDSNTPGTYKAVYTLDYLGTSVSNSVKVTILENPDKETGTTPVETAAETSGEAATETSVEKNDETATSAAGETQNTENAETGMNETQTVSWTEPITAVVEQVLPDAEITLSNGRVVSVKMTSARYITETYTVDAYFEEDGMTFLSSELRVVFNTGEEQVIETVVTRVQPQNTAVE